MQSTIRGEVTMAGYVGSEDEFAAAGGEQCVPCPGDRTLYGGKAQLDGDSSTFACNVAATAALSGKDNFLNPPAMVGDTSVDWHVHAHSAPFPTMGFPYPIQVGDGQLTEVLYVYNATNSSTTSGQQTLSVGTASRTTAFKYGSHVAMGKLVSAMGSGSDLLVVIQHPLATVGHPFSIRGPYDIRAGEQALVVSAASIAVNKPLQVLRTQNVPAQPMGYTTYLQQPAYTGDTVITVAPFRFLVGQPGGSGGDELGATRLPVHGVAVNPRLTGLHRAGAGAQRYYHQHAHMAVRPVVLPRWRRL